MLWEMQAKILRVLQDKVVAPVGGQSSYRVDVRIVAATHQDLAKKVQDGAFRQDLYFRLNVLNIRLPALRERGWQPSRGGSIAQHPSAASLRETERARHVRAGLSRSSPAKLRRHIFWAKKGCLCPLF